MKASAREKSKTNSPKGSGPLRKAGAAAMSHIVVIAKHDVGQASSHSPEPDAAGVFERRRELDAAETATSLPARAFEAFGSS